MCVCVCVCVCVGGWVGGWVCGWVGGCVGRWAYPLTQGVGLRVGKFSIKLIKVHLCHGYFVGNQDFDHGLGHEGRAGKVNLKIRQMWSMPG